MNYTIYQTTNNINGKIYIGMHQTTDINDTYLGSGKVLQQAITKYGDENFTKEILHLLDSKEEMGKKEAELVNADFIARKDTYNLREGGAGGQFSSETLGRMSEAKKGRTYEEIYGAQVGKKLRKLRSLEASGQNNNFYNKTHSDEVKEQLSAIKKVLYKNKENHPRTGAVITREHKALLSKVHKGKIVSKETRQKMAEGKINNKNGSGNKGKSWSPARRAAYESKKEITHGMD